MHENQHWLKRKKNQTHNLVHDYTESTYYILDKILGDFTENAQRPNPYPMCSTD